MIESLHQSTSTAPWIVFASVLVYGVLHSWLASLAVKGWLQRVAGGVSQRFYRLVYNLAAGITFLPVLALLAILPDRPIYAIAFPWISITLLLQVLALLALLAGVLQTGIWTFLGIRQVFKPGEEASTLVVSGLYRYVRHPLYAAGLVFIWLAPRMTVNLLALNAGLTLYLLVGAWVEERKLRRQFGPAYDHYRQRTPMLIPGLKF